MKQAGGGGNPQTSPREKKRLQRVRATSSGVTILMGQNATVWGGMLGGLGVRETPTGLGTVGFWKREEC